MLLREVIPQELPLLVLWGDKDPFTPADGPVGRFFQALPQQRDNTTFTFLPGGLRSVQSNEWAGRQRMGCAAQLQVAPCRAAHPRWLVPNLTSHA